MNDTEKKPTCAATKDDGSPCSSTILVDGEHCAAHAPGGRETMAERGRKSAASRRSGGRTKFNPEDLPPLTSHEAVQVWNERIARACASGELDNRVANSIARHLKTWLEAQAEKFTLRKVQELEEKVGDLKEALKEAQKEPWE